MEEIITEDVAAFEAMRRGVLNFSAYAEVIHSKVEDLSLKKVNKGTIVVALSRLAPELQEVESLFPLLELDDLTIKSPLSDISYHKTEENLIALRKFQKSFDVSEKQFLMMTQSVREITVIVPTELKQKLFSVMKDEPKETFDDLVGITISFSPSYLSMPNVIYAIISRLAIQRINIREIVSTYTEISVVIDKKDMNLALDSLQVFFDKKEKNK